MVYGPQSCVGHYCEIEDLISDHVGEIGVVVPEEGYPTSIQVSSIGERTGARKGAGWVREVTAAHVSGWVGCAVKTAATVDVVWGVWEVHACGGRGRGLGGGARSPSSVVPVRGLSGGASR